MTTKEKILRELDNLDEEELDALYKLVQRFLDAQRVNAAAPSFLERLSRIQINGPEDFAENVDLYLLNDPLAHYIGGVEHGALAQAIDEELYDS